MKKLLILAVSTLILSPLLFVVKSGGAEPNPFLAMPSAPLSSAHARQDRPMIQRASLSLTPLAAPPPVVLPAMDPTEAFARWERLEGWMKCVNTPCLLPEGDSREAAFAARDGILAEGQWFLEHSAQGKEQQKRAYAGASRLLAYPDEQVQAMAMQWMLQLPPKAETLDLIQANLADMVDTDLTRSTLLELRRHMGTDREEKAISIVENLLFHGSIFASREVARDSALLIYDGNRKQFEQWLEKLPEYSAKKRLLQEALRQGQLET